MSVCDETDKVKVAGKPHELNLAGTYLNSLKVLIQIKTVYDASV